MSSKVTKIVIGKGKTTGDEKASEWTRRYYEVEVSIGDEHEIEIAKANVEGLIDGWLGKPVEAKPKPQEPTGKPEAPLEIEQCFPKELAELLNFEDKGTWIRVSPKQFLGSDNFARVLAIVKELKGEYVSAGKGSHFRIPKVEG
ncbi:MAG: hypothetical protein NWE99_01220 [Candidatus Bathyarchaeota archaeon]|nr:hypothetical protein [Candidatus Bathyarchaeota archaeon]